MGDANETSHILQGKTQRELLELRDIEILKTMKLRLILQTLRGIRATDNKQVGNALAAISMADYLNLGIVNGKEANRLLNLRQNDVLLSYLERKAVRQQLFLELKKTLQPAAAFSEKLRTKMPDLFTTSSLATAKADPSQDIKNIMALEEQRRANLLTLVALRNRKCGLLRIAAELKMGPYMGHELSLLLAHARNNQTKADVLHTYFVEELTSRTEHTCKALAEVCGYVDKAQEENQTKQ